MQCVRLTRTLMVILPLVISLLAGVTVASAKFLAREQTTSANMGLIFQNTHNNAWYWMNPDGTELHQIAVEGAALNPVWDSQTNHLYYVCRHLFSEVCAIDITRGISVRVPLPTTLLFTLDDFIVSLRDVYRDELILGDVLPNGDLYLYDVNTGELTSVPQREGYSMGRIYWYAHP